MPAIHGVALRTHDIDLEIATKLTEQDLEKLGFSLGHRRKFLAAAAKLRARGLTEAPAAADEARSRLRAPGGAVPRSCACAQVVGLYLLRIAPASSAPTARPSQRR